MTKAVFIPCCALLLLASRSERKTPVVEQRVADAETKPAQPRVVEPPPPLPPVVPLTPFQQLEKRAQGGDVESQFKLGAAYASGTDTPKDEWLAFAWIAKAAGAGHAEAQFNLGSMYELGSGVAKDEAKAIEWFEKAADKGLVDAQFNLARMYADGRGAEQDFAKAVGWYDKAAVRGLTRAQFNLGIMYALGQGVPKDSVKAYAWFFIAAANGDPSAQQNCTFIESKVNAYLAFIQNGQLLEENSGARDRKVKIAIHQKYPEPTEVTPILDRLAQLLGFIGIEGGNPAGPIKRYPQPALCIHLSAPGS